MTTQLVIIWILVILKKIAIDLSKQTKLKDTQINFIGKFENQHHGATMFLTMRTQNLQQKNGMLLTAKHQVLIQKMIQ